MLKKISFSSYKKFKDENIVEIKPVTVLVGRNSSGKSSVCKLFPMLAKSITPYSNISPLLFDNDGICLGTSFSDISHNGDAFGLSFGMKFTDGIDMKINLFSEDLNQSIEIGRYELIRNNEEYVLSFDKKEGCYHTNFQRDSYPYDSILGFYCEELFKRIGIDDRMIDMDVDYIGPFRIIPHRTYYSKGIEIKDRVGILGENSYSELYNNFPLAKAVSDWYLQNFGVLMSIDDVEGEKGAYHINLMNPVNKRLVNIVDEGQGMSQVLPIVVRCNMQTPEAIVVMEQPELHLHPKAHAALGRLFASTSKANGQNYVVETHSENLLLGLRDAVVDEQIDFSPDDVIIYFVDEDEEDGSAYLREIRIDSDGMLSDWPEGIFNESYDLLSEIKAKALARKNNKA